MAKADVVEEVSATQQVHTDAESRTEPVTMQGHLPLLLGYLPCIASAAKAWC
jgi:hypothetical protein